jgi:hypothetical protein
MAGVIAACALGVVLAAGLGMVVERTGRAFLHDAFRDDRVSRPVAQLLLIMYGLLSVGAVAVIGTADMPSLSWYAALALKLGLLVLVLGAACVCVVTGLLIVRKYRRRELLEEQLVRRLRPEPRGRFR